MARLKQKLKVLHDVIIANLLKLRVKYDFYIRHSIRISDHVEPSVMVTLTSYGHRLRHSVEYTLYSLLKQDLRPGRIVVWVYEGEFSGKSLPKSRRLLEQYGVEFRKYPENIKSYKKLIPALQEHSDYHHIIVDDDIYYTPELVQELFSQHQIHPQAIIAEVADIPLFDSDNKTLLPYKKWKQYTKVGADFQYDTMTIMPIGYGGVFYPKGIFDKEILDSETFLKLCPLADDIWFYIHSIRLQIEKIKVPCSKVRFLPVDLLRQYIQSDRLTDINRKKNENDRQLGNLLAHYSLEISHG